MSADPQVRKLRESLEEAQERIRQLEEALSPRLVLPEDWKLTPAEQRFVATLVVREFCSYETLLCAIRLNEEIDGRNLIHVRLHNIRRKLGRERFRVRHVRGVGLSLENRAEWTKRIAPRGKTMPAKRLSA